MNKGTSTANWFKICSPIENEGLKINNLQHENNAYLLKLNCSFAYSNISLEFLSLNMSLDWLIVPLLFQLGLNSFTPFLSIPLELLVQVMILICSI